MPDEATTGYALKPMLLLHLACTGELACASRPTDSAAGGSAAVADSAEITLDPEVTQGGDTPVRRVRWTTPEASSGQVEYGVDSLDSVLVDDEIGTEHDVLVAGMPAGVDWQLRVVSETEAERWASEVLPMAAVYAPTGLPVPSLTVPPTEAVNGFQLVPLPATGGAYVAMLNRTGEPVWWNKALPQSVFRSRYDAAAQTVTYVGLNQDTGAQTFITSTLEREETRVPAPQMAHQDFALLPEGGFVVLVLDDRDVDGTTVRGESLQEVAPDGSVRVLWSSWDSLTWDGSGMQTEGGAIEWPHANSLSYDADRRKVMVSLFYLDAIAQIDRDTGTLDWLLGGEQSDWTVEGEGFAGQHAPVMLDDGRLLVLMDNGPLASGGKPAEARAYDLNADTMTATERWTFDDGAVHTGVILGDVSWIGDDAAVVNWGSTGLIQQVNAAGEIQMQLNFGLGEFAEFSEHIDELAGATR